MLNLNAINLIMGNGESNGIEVCDHLLQLIKTTPADNLSKVLEEALDKIEHPETLLKFQIPSEYCLNIIKAITPIVHKKALAINSSYSSLKEEELPNISIKGVLERLLVLGKAVAGSLSDSSRLMEYLWNVEDSKKIPPAIHLAETCSVLLFTDGLITFFDNVSPSSFPLEIDE